MSIQPTVLIVDDHIDDISWLVDLLQHRGYKVHVETNEKDARRQLEHVREGKVIFCLAIIDIMVSVSDISELANLDEKFYSSSRETGVRLCRYARQELGISSETLPIACISARADHEHIQQLLGDLTIPLFSRVPQSREESLREFVKSELPARSDQENILD